MATCLVSAEFPGKPGREDRVLMVAVAAVLLSWMIALCTGCADADAGMRSQRHHDCWAGAPAPQR